MSLRILSSTIAILWLAQATAEAAPDPVETWLADQHTAGGVVAAAVARVDGERVVTHGVGRRTDGADTKPDGATQFQIGSITKVFTHLLLAELVASGDVRYDTPLGERLPKGVKPRNPAVERITLQALATHHSGLPRMPANLDLRNTTDPYGGFDTAELHEAIETTRDKQRLGSFYTYSNFGAAVLGAVLGEVNGKGYRAALTERVLVPLHLRHAAFRPNADAVQANSGGKAVTAWTFDAFVAAGGLWASVDDLARLIRAYLGTHEHSLAHDLGQDLEVVAPAANFDITRVWHVAHAGAAPIYWHNGGTGGFHSFVGFRPDTKRGIAILVSGDADPTEVGLAALGVTPRAVPRAKIDAAVFGQYALTPQFGIGVFARDGQLLTQATGQPAFVLHAVGEDWYALGEVDASVHAVRDGGDVIALELAQNGVVQRARRVADVAAATMHQEIAVAAAVLRDYVGEYAFAPGVVLTLRLTGETLEAQLTGQPFFPVFAKGTDRFFYKVVDAELAFERGKDGKVAAVVLHQAGIEQRATRKR